MGEKSRSLDVLLTHGFAPWEQYSRHSRQGAYTDVYGLAATFYYAVTGQIPLDAADRIKKDELIPFRRLNIDAPAQFESALWKALAVYPEDRFQDMNAFQRALGKYPVKKTEEGREKKITKKMADYDKPKWRRPVLTAIAVICIAAAVFAGFRALGSGMPGAESEALGEAEEISAEPDRQEPSREDPDEIENDLNTPANSGSEYGYTVVDGRDPGIIIRSGGGS